MTYAGINNWLAVGNTNSCDASFTVCVHINRDDMPHHDCKRCPHDHDFFINYQDGDKITDELFAQLDEIAAFIKGLSTKTVLVHCMAGQTRSPFIAAYLLAAVEEMHPIDAYFLVVYANYEQRGVTSNMCLTPMQQLFERFAPKDKNQ